MIGLKYLAMQTRDRIGGQLLGDNGIGQKKYRQYWLFA